MRSDSDRGLERVGRDLAVQQKVSWREYWEFLDAFVNLREDEGLQMLDAYLLNCDLKFISRLVTVIIGVSANKLVQI